MIPIHYIARQRKREGWYQVRIYSVKPFNEQGGSVQPKGFMSRHAELLVKEKGYPKEPIDISAYLKPLPSIKQAIDSELLQGEVSWDSITLQFAPHVILRDIIRAMRDAGEFGGIASEVWCEITLEQMVTDCPDPKPHEMVWPRKTRSVFWGRLNRKDVNYDIDDEKWITDDDMNADPDVMNHAGMLELSFAHWILPFTNRSAETFLDDYRTSYSGIITDFWVPASDLLYKLTYACLPFQLAAISDKNLLAKDAMLDSDESVTRCNFEVFPTFRAGTLESKKLWNLRLRIRKQVSPGPTPPAQAVWSSLFEKGDGAPSWSLYERFSSLGEGIALLTKEFFLKFQVELPLMQDFLDDRQAFGSFSNVDSNRNWKWHLTARALFLDWDEAPLVVETHSKKETIKTSPAAAWLKHIHVEEPMASGMDDSLHDSRHEWDWPDHVPVIIDDAGVDISYTTLFGVRVQKKEWTPSGVVSVPDVRGWEFWLYDPENPSTPILVDTTFYTKKDAVGIEFGFIWAHVHANRIASQWGAPRAVIEWEQDGVWLEAFGSQSPRCLRKPEGTFGMGDWGDFPMLRKKFVSPGILFAEKEVAAITTFDIERTPGGNTKMRAIERSKEFSDDFVPPTEPDDPPPPPPPPNDDPPSITIDTNLTGAQSGTVSLGMTATDDYEVKRVKMYVNSVFIGNATQGSGNSWSYSWDTTAHPNGAVLLQARAEDESLQYGYDSKTVTITN